MQKRITETEDTDEEIPPAQIIVEITALNITCITEFPLGCTLSVWSEQFEEQSLTCRLSIY